MIRSILLAAGLSLAAVSTAAAVTPPAKPGVVSSDLVEVKKKKGYGKKWGKKKRYRGSYQRRHHYRSPPPGWSRYSHRPRGWARRGCLAFGPIWYCP
jgi:hypothetical protein